MGLSYLHFQQPAELGDGRKPGGNLLTLETQPVPLSTDHVRALLAGSEAALAAVFDCPKSLLGKVRADPKPVLSVAPDIIAEVGKRLEVLEILVERPRGLTKARRFEKALGTDRLQSEAVRKALV